MKFSFTFLINENNVGLFEFIFIKVCYHFIITRGTQEA